MTLFGPEKELLLAVELDCVPKVKERPRAVKATGAIYTPKTTREAEAKLRLAWLETVGEDVQFDRPIDVRWQFYNDHYALEVWTAEDYTQRKLRGDTDNYMKLASDALNALAWTDDRLIVCTSGEKM